MASFTPNEKKLIDYAKKKILENCEIRKSKGLYDVIYAFVLSNSGKIYGGIPLECMQPFGGICAERQAIANMILEETEKAKIISILIADPVPKKEEITIMPCGVCRSVINEFSGLNTSVLCTGFIRKDDKWEMFPKIYKYIAKKLYPYPYIVVKKSWD